jgi:cell division protein FtsL
MAHKKVVGTDYIPENYTPKKEKQKQKVKASHKSFWVLKVTPGMVVIALIFLIGMSLVVQNVWINFLGFQISQLKKDISNIQVSNEKLKLKIASMGSLDKIENIAINKLGMVYPQSKSIHYIFPQNTSNKEQARVPITGFVPPTNSKNRMDNNGNIEQKIPQKAWLGTVQDFFYRWLLGESKN